MIFFYLHPRVFSEFAYENERQWPYRLAYRSWYRGYPLLALYNRL